MGLSFGSGLIIGLGLIVAIGAQNLLVLQYGIQKNHPALTALICIVCDATLILAGVLGLGTLLQSFPQIIEWFRWLGALWLVILAGRNIRVALSSSALISASSDTTKSAKLVITTTLAVTLLNPHVYLDTVILLGGISTQYSQPLMFATGAITGSVLWFSGLAFAGVQLAPWLSRPKVWRVLNFLIAILLLVIAWQLAVVR